MVAKLSLRNLLTLAIAVVFVPILSQQSHAHGTERDHHILSVHGDLRLIASDDLNAIIHYRDLYPGPTLWGIGMPEGLDAELLVLGGKGFSGAFRNGVPDMRQGDPDRLAIFVHAHIPHWHEIPLPAHVKSFDELADFIDGVGTVYGFDADTGFPFRLEADVETLDWFVVGGMGNLSPTPIESFLKSRTMGSLNARSVITFGTFARDLEGIASVPGSALHLHFATDDDEPLFVGHLNNDVQFSPGGKLFLPKTR